MASTGETGTDESYCQTQKETNYYVQMGTHHKAL